MPIPNPIVVDMGVAEPQIVPMTVSENGVVIGMSVGTAIEVGNARLQAKTVIPADDEQIVTADEGFNGLSTVTVERIPSNYGKITWNGVFITVS